MTREIKFRAWLEEEMIYGDPSYVWDMTTDGDPKMQYTGLLDKNGKEVYEGDIVRHCNGGIGKVEFEQFGWSPFIFVPDTEKVYEIIGNIYENPELLEI